MAYQESSSSSSGASHCRYHVFLSFRGKDTRKTFTDHLYTAFKDQGFRTFRDDDELERGEDISPGIEKAIQQSRSSVIVFSSDFASSSWCLNELLMILERRRTSDHVVLPVFYDVDPSQLRKQTGSFGEAFAGYQTTQPSDKVKEWKDALREIADVGGMVLRNQDDGYESKFIKTIVREIGDKLSRTVPLSVGSNLIGIDARANKINRWIVDGPNDVGIHVIFGMSGIGKTTVAKHVYNSNFESFEGSSFIENIRQTSEQINGIVRLQKQLLYDILNKREVKIRNASEGKTAIEDAISCKRILLVLDDVDHMDQFDALLTMKDRFHKRSKIIITTRRAWVLKAPGITKVHYVRALKEDESLRLFSLHAFRQDHPLEGYLEQTEKFVRHCAGLPLALRVLGSSLFGENLAVWESALRKLESIPNSEVVHKLRMSYDALDKHDQEVFLHIACFFIGNEKDYTVDVLDECELYTTIGIINLIDRCLVAIGANNKLVMHDMVRDMGRGIVRLAAEEPRKRSRLWHHKESFKVLKEKNGTKKIEGLELNMQRQLGDTTASKNMNEIILETNAFAKMHNLRLLRLSHVQLTGRYEEIPTGLRMLCWTAFPLDSVPSNFHLENLVVLEMHYSSLRQILNGAKCFPSLKILDLSHSRGLIAMVDFSLCPNLEKLTLMDCDGLIDVHESIGNLERLVYLNMKDCRSLRRLPNTIGMLKLLDTLIMSGCSNLNNSSIEMVRSMESLKVLELDRIPISQLYTLCGEVKSLNLPCSLLSLSLSGCNLTDEAFPVDFSSLSLLKNVNLSENSISSLPNCIKGMKSLRELSFENCLRLESLVELPEVSYTLTVSGCESLKRITYQSSSCMGPNMSGRNPSLVEWEYNHKLEPIRSVDAELLNILGLRKFDLDAMPNFRICKPYYGFDVVHPSGIQGLHDYGGTSSYFVLGTRKVPMFNTFLPGNEVPGQFSHRTKGSSSISFTVPTPSVHGLKIRGFNIFVVYAISDNDDERSYSSKDEGELKIDLINKSNDDNWHYAPVYHGIPRKGEDMIWLTHWNMDNKIKGGDQIAVSHSIRHAKFRYHVKEWGIQVVEEKQEQKSCTDQNANGGDLLTSDEPLRGTSCEPDSTADKDKSRDDEEAAVVDPTPASTMRAGSNSNNDQGLRRWKVLIVAAIVLVAAISVANSFEDSNLDTNVAKTVTNAEEEEEEQGDEDVKFAEQGDEDVKFAVATDGSNNRAGSPRKWMVPIIAAVMLILYLSVRWFFFSMRDTHVETILVPT